MFFIRSLGNEIYNLQLKCSFVHFSVRMHAFYFVCSYFKIQMYEIRYAFVRMKMFYQMTYVLTVYCLHGRDKTKMRVSNMKCIERL